MHLCIKRTCTYIAILDHHNPFQPFHNDTFQILLSMAAQSLNTASFDSISRFHHECHRLLAVSQRILDLECHSSSITNFGQLILSFIFSIVPLNKSTMHSFILHSCTFYASKLKRFYFVALWQCLMKPLKANSHWKMKDMRVAVEILTYPLLSDIHHISSDDNISFDCTTPHSTGTSQSHHKPIQCQLSFSTSDDEDSSADDIPPTYSTTPPENPLGFVQQTCYKPIYTMCDDLEEDKEDFQTVQLDDDHWTTEEIPDRHFCIHGH